MGKLTFKNGQTSLAGETIGTLAVGAIAALAPEIRYETACTRCGSHSTAPHSKLKQGTARCLASGCAVSKKQTRVTDLENQVRERNAAELKLRRDLSDARMQAETEGYELPNYDLPQLPSDLSHQRDYDRRERQKAMAEIQAELDAPRLAKEREAAERLEAQRVELQSTANQLASLERDAIAKGRDPEFQVDPATQSPENGIAPHQVDTWNLAQAGAFQTQHPEFFACTENADAIAGYLKRNFPGLVLISSAQLAAAFKRLREYGLLRERPKPAPKPAPAPQVVTVEESTPAEPTERYIIGYDLEHGGTRPYSQHEIDRMSAAEFRRTFPTSAQCSGISWERR